jgi:TRAP-type mannitol/chloroaromatic compound transport system permease small subunit
MQALANIANAINRLNNGIGKWVAWLALTMVLIQFIVVVMRYIFGLGSIMMQESILYMHAILFLAGAGYTLLHEGHVRVDIFYREAMPRTKAIVDLCGAVFFLIPVSVLIWFYSWGYVLQSWSVFEGSKETSGIQGVFLLKTVILVFCGLMIIQGVSMIIASILRLKGREDLIPVVVEDGV